MLRPVLVLCTLIAMTSAIVADDVLNDDRVANKLGQLRGQVIIENHPELGRTPAAGHFLTFQRRDCAKCAVGVRCDLNGNYELFLSAGDYRVISTGSQIEGEGPDLISPAQPHTVTVKLGPEATVFNVILRLPSSWGNRR